MRIFRRHLKTSSLQATTKDPRERYATVEDMAADLLTVLASSRAGEKRFVPQDVGNDETKIMPSADIQAAIAANQDGKTQVVAHKSKQPTLQRPAETTESQTDADEEPLPTRSWSKTTSVAASAPLLGRYYFVISRGRDRRFGIKVGHR